jgi:hypothetical protein
VGEVKEGAVSEIETAAHNVRRGIKIHQRRIVCRALMWEAIRRAVTEENVRRVLDALGPEERKYLRDIYDEFPPSLWSCCPPDEHSRCAAIEQWCQQPPNE